ncbi:MAG: S41 family peptidase [Bacteroidia bacterium]|nr:S41 family peptidase [Bacteroidia bacterium]
MRLFLIFFMGLFFCVALFGQKQHSPTFTLNPTQMREDLDSLRSALYSTPTDPFAFIRKEEIELYLATLEDSIQKPRSVLWFYRMLNPLLVSLKDIHTRIWLSWAANPYARSGGFYLPLKIRYFQQRVYVADDPHNRIKRGSELIAINGVAAVWIIRKLLEEHYTDGNIVPTRIGLMEENFANSLPLFFPVDSINALQLRAPASTRDTLILYPGITKTKKPGKVRKKFQETFALKLLPSDRTAILTIGSFAKSNELKYRAFLRQSFHTIRKQEVQNLVIDIRGNKGGYIIRGPELLAYLSEKPFYYAHTSIVRASPLLKKRIKYDMIAPGITIPVFKKFVGRELVSGWKNPVGTYDTLMWEPTPPKPEKLRFLGNTYLLTNGLSISNSCLLHHAFTLNQMGKVIGTSCGCIETGTFGNSVEFILPNSRITGRVSTIRLTSRKDDFRITEEGLAPDMVVEDTIQDFLDGKDTQLEFVLKLIRNQ